MIYAIGFPNFQGITSIETDLPVLNKDDVVVINVRNRFLFKTGSTPTSYSLKAILPTLSQKEALRQFLWNGGTIIVNYHFISEQKRHFFAHSFRKPSPLF
ncbi:hypothetical protein [Geobacillus stearothermophilus]|uniref:hypothetical protein n=1 Tax=Geobacillus stearothermophilus TaxID=1422 RepID=UPI003D19CDF6